MAWPVKAIEAAARLKLSKKFCPYGHPYSGDNLYIGKNGARNCRCCHKNAVLRFRGHL